MRNFFGLLSPAARQLHGIIYLFAPVAMLSVVPPGKTKHFASSMTETLPQEQPSAPTNYSRRRFLGLAGAIAGAGLLATGVTSCKKEEDDPGVDLGSGDFGVLNFAYALEQLEAEFYTRVVANFYFNAGTSDFSDLERTFLTEIRDHEIAHREFLKNALGPAAIPQIEFDFSSVDFQKRTSVLSTARIFEDLGVSAYNGAGQLLSSEAYLTLAGKIVSVEARHAAAVRDLIANGSFADATVVGGDGLDVVRSPAQVLAIAAPFFKRPINGKNLPTS